MQGSSIARRWGTALFEAASGAGAVAEVEVSLASVVTLVWGEERLRGSIQSDRVPVQAKKKLIDDVLGLGLAGTVDAAPSRRLVRNFLYLAVDKRRERHVPEAARWFAALADKVAGVVNVEVRTAVELDDPGRRNLREALAGSFGDQVRLNFVVDPALVGGLVVKIEDRLFDASLRRRLERLGEHLAKARVGA